MGQQSKKGCLEKTKHSEMFATARKQNNPLEMDGSIINKSLMFFDAQGNILDTHGEKELCSCELKKSF
jgi:hypothetical protein